MFALIVLAACAVVVCVGVVVVAMGRGGQLGDSSPDHPPLGLPDRRPIVGTDIALLQLPAALWGYNRAATDEALRRLALALSERDTRVAVLEQRYGELRRQRAGEESEQERTAVDTSEPIAEQEGAPPPLPASGERAGPDDLPVLPSRAFKDTGEPVEWFTPHRDPAEAREPEESEGESGAGASARATPNSKKRARGGARDRKRSSSAKGKPASTARDGNDAGRAAEEPNDAQGDTDSGDEEAPPGDDGPAADDATPPWPAPAWPPRSEWPASPDDVATTVTDDQLVASGRGASDEDTAPDDRTSR